MNSLIKKLAQTLANNIIQRLEIAMKNDNDREFKMLLEIGFSLNMWCIKKGIELE